MAATAAAIGLLALPVAASGATLSVTTFNDEFNTSGAGVGCSVREAIEAASTTGAFGGCDFGSDDNADTIVLAAGSTYARSALTGIDDVNAMGDLDIRNEPLTIRAAAGPNAQLDGTGGTTGDRVIDVVSPVDVTIIGVDLANGNTSFQGGGIRMGIAGPGGSLTMNDLAVFGNHASLFGGGIEMLNGVLNLTDVTIASNGANGNGGAGLDVAAGTANLNSVTVTNNTTTMGAGGGIYRFGGAVNLFNTIVAGNIDSGGSISAPDCSGDALVGPTSLGFNLIGDTTNCGYAPAGTDIVNPVSAGLAPFATINNTRVYPLLASSPAIDAGATLGVPATDQRGLARPQGARCDIGAFELSATNDSPSCAGPVAGPAPGPATIPATVPAPPAGKHKKCKKRKGKHPRDAHAAKKKHCKKKRAKR
jgi:hypothetical protein